MNKITELCEIDMIKVLVDEKTVICPKCKSHLLYGEDDVQTKEIPYMVYGCEERWERYNIIVCPKCGQEISAK